GRDRLDPHLESRHGGCHRWSWPAVRAENVFVGGTALCALRRWGPCLLLVFMVMHDALSGAGDHPVFRSSSGQFTLLKPIKPVPDASIRALDGAKTSPGQFHGMVVLLNFWAAWCGPCVYEMPSLDRLAARAIPGLAILAVSIDRNGAKAVAPFVR